MVHSPPLRLWYLADTRLPGEAANTVQVMKMSAAFAECGCDVRLYARLKSSRSASGIFDFYAVQPLFQIARAPRLVPGRSRNDVWNLAFSLSALPYLKLNRQRFDLLYTRIPFLAAWAASLKIPVGFEAHRLLPSEGLLRTRFEKRFLRSTRFSEFRGLIAISQVLVDWYIGQGVPREKCLVAHDGVDLERFTPMRSKNEARSAAGLPNAKPIVCYAGHLYSGRGTEELLSCAREMKEVLFVFAGGSERDVSKFKERAAALKLDNARFTGFVPNGEMAGYLFAADVLAMPYNSDTGSARFMSPMKMFEYMAAGRPIVATRFPSVCEVLRDGENAILVEPGNASALKSGLERALRPEAEMLGSRAREDVTEFTWRTRAERILGFLRSARS
jgi:glycosyltransferase involved in cell wall biosynthesis